MTQTSYKRRTYFGESEAKPLVYWLNVAPARRTRPVVSLLGSIAALGHAYGEGPLVRVKKGKGKGVTGRLQEPGAVPGESLSFVVDGKLLAKAGLSRGEIRKLTGDIAPWKPYKVVTLPVIDRELEVMQARQLKQINKEIASLYASVPALGCKVGASWGVIWNWGHGQISELRRAVHIILQLAELGVLEKVRRCEACSKWYFAKREKYYRGSCGDRRCRQKLYSSKPETKEKRNRRDRYRRAARKHARPNV